MKDFPKPCRGMWVLCVFAAFACSDNKPMPVPDNPHRVLLTSKESHVVGDAVHVIVSVQGCSQVLQAQVLQEETPIAEVHFENSTAHVTLPSKLFEPFYPTLGIETHLNLKARVKCANGRVNDSPAVGVSFLPVASAVEREDGSMAASESFIAIGGAGHAPTTFLGCAQSPENDMRGPFLAHFDTRGEVLDRLYTSPLQCSAYTQIFASERGHYWAYTPGSACSLFAFRTHPLRAITSVRETANCTGFAMDAEGNAYIVVFDVTGLALARISIHGEAWSSPPRSSAINLTGIPTSPVISGDTVSLPLWTVSGYADTGRLEVVQFDISGRTSTLGGHRLVPLCGPDSGDLGSSIKDCPLLSGLAFAQSASTPVPAAVLSKDGTRLYLAQGNHANNYFVVSYDLSTSRQEYIWGPFEAPITKLSLYRDERFLVASTLKSVRFLATNPFASAPVLGETLTVSGSLMATEHIHGPENSLIILARPFFTATGNNKWGWPLEAVAVDTPELGELWRFTYWGSGNIPVNAITATFDEGGNMWMRVGTQLVKLLPKEDYRKARTPKP